MERRAKDGRGSLHHGLSHGHTRGRGPGHPGSEARGREHDRDDHRGVRLRPLRDRRRARLRQAVLPERDATRRHAGFIRDVRRRLPRPPCRRRDLRPLRRQGRAQEDADPGARDHGRRDRADRRAAGLQLDRHLGPGPAGRAATHPGRRTRRRVGRRRADGHRVRPQGQARILRLVAADRLRRRPRDLHLAHLDHVDVAERRGVPELGLARAVLRVRAARRRRPLHPPADRGDPRVHRAAAEAGAREGAGRRGLQGAPEERAARDRNALLREHHLLHADHVHAHLRRGHTEDRQERAARGDRHLRDASRAS